MRKGIFIPDITVEMFKNASLEAVEELLVSGTMEDIEIPDRPHGEWISCKERLPEEHGYYIVTTDGSHNDVIDIAEYGLFWHNMKLEMMWNKASKILAWMPLPEPYKKEGEWKCVEDPDYSGGGYLLCTACNYRFSLGTYRILEHDGFCPHCGAVIKNRKG